MYTVVDIGCRNGPRVQWIRADTHIIGFDPDAEECERLSKEFAPHQFVPLALDGNKGLRTFYQTECNECGSFLKPRQDLGWSAHRIIGTVQIETRTLDGWCLEHNIAPDLIKLDTQGTELYILEMAKLALAKCAVVICEVEFNPLYERQPLFGDVDKFLRSEGYELHSLADINYVRGQIWWADAHYFRPSLLEVAEALDPL